VRGSEREAFDAWQRDPALVSPPGGESAFAIAARSLPVILRAGREHPAGRVMLVSHKATIRVIVCALLGMPLGRFRSHISCPTASITSFEFGSQGSMLLRVGDVHHLE
jgi:probable phosphoglycerate mutase